MKLIFLSKACVPITGHVTESAHTYADSGGSEGLQGDGCGRGHVG